MPANLDRPRAPAEARARLEQDRRRSACRQCARCADPGCAAANDRDVEIRAHGFCLSTTQPIVDFFAPSRPACPRSGEESPTSRTIWCNRTSEPSTRSSSRWREGESAKSDRRRLVVVHTDVVEDARRAKRFSRLADVAAMQNQPMMGVAQEALRNDLHEFVLDRARRLTGSDAEPVGHSEDVRVHRECRFAESGVQDDIRRLAADPGQSFKGGPFSRRLPVMLFHDRLRQRNDVPSLRTIEPDRLDQPGEPLFAEGRHLLRRVCDGEQRLRGPVDPGVRCLRRQHHRHQQRERIDGFELSLGLGIGCRPPLLSGQRSNHSAFIGCSSSASHRGRRRGLPCRAAARNMQQQGGSWPSPRRRIGRTIMKRMNCALMGAGALGALLAFGPAEAASNKVVIGDIDDMSGPYADILGAGGIEAIKMAIADFGGTVLGQSIEIVTADHQNKPDIGQQKFREWADTNGLTMQLGGSNTGVSLALSAVAKEKKIPFFAIGAAGASLTGKDCTPYTIHYGYDTTALANGTAKTILEQGGKSWFFLTADYAYGTQLEKGTSDVVKAGGGTVVGGVRVPLGTPDFAY